MHRYLFEFNCGTIAEYEYLPFLKLRFRPARWASVSNGKRPDSCGRVVERRPEQLVSTPPAALERQLVKYAPSYVRDVFTGALSSKAIRR